MEEIKNNFAYFKKKYGDIYNAYSEYGKAVHTKGGPLDEKTRCLIKIAISSSSGFSYALRTHINKALGAGCSRDEIEHTILMIAPTCGFPRMMEALLILRDELGE